MPVRPFLALPFIAMGSLLLAGCSQGSPPLDPGRVNHVVFIKLADPADAAELEDDCDRLLESIPSIRTYACGGHFDFGRAAVNSDYTVGLLVSFDDAEGYRAYLEAPAHVELVEKWKPRWAAATIYDIEYVPDQEDR